MTTRCLHPNSIPPTGLTPGTQYFYHIIPANPNASLIPSPTPISTFKTPPAMGNPNQMTFDVVGDLGQTPDSQSTLDHMSADWFNHSQFIIHAGDMSYADCFGPRWDHYFDMIAPLASRMPWMVAAGNHEIEPNNLTGNIMDPYKARYAMPEVAPTQDTTQYYQVPSQDGFDCTPSAFTGSYDFGNSFYSFKAGLVRLKSLARCFCLSVCWLWRLPCFAQCIAL